MRRNQDNWLPSIFNDFFDNRWMERPACTAPAINVTETEKDYEVELAAPGLAKEDFHVNVDAEGNLQIQMEKKEETKHEGGKRGRFLRREFAYGKFHQTLMLPEDVDAQKIEARVKDGVLTVLIPKKEQVEAPETVRQIEIQ